MLNKEELKRNIKGTLEQLYLREDITPAQARETFASALAEHIDNYIKQGIVTTQVVVSGNTGVGTGYIE